MNTITINTTSWVNGRTRLNQTNMNKIERNLNTIVSKVNELVDFANGYAEGVVTDVKVGGTSVVTDGVALIPAIPSNPMTASGDMVIGGASGAATRLAAGAQGSVLHINSDNNPSWTGLKTVNGATLTGSGAVSIGDSQPLGYLDSNPSVPNASGLKIVILDSEPATRQDGYLYIIIGSGS